MRAIRLTLLASIVCTVSSFGGEIYGTIKEGERPVGKGVTIEIQTNVDRPYSAVTDEFGNYRVIVREIGRFPITVQFNGQSITGYVQSYWTPAKFDWALKKTGERYLLERQ
jgi:hypothetical protein